MSKIDLAPPQISSDLWEIFSYLPLACFVLNSAQKILEANHCATKLLKLERHALLGRNLNRYLNQRHRKTFHTHLAALTDSNHEILELELLDYHGKNLPIEARIVKIENKNDNDNEIYYLFTASDLSERQLAEERLRMQQTELAHAYRFLTLGEMARGLAHEINQPLTAILNYANTGLRKLQNGQLSNEATQNLLDQVAKQVQRAAEVIRRLRSLLQKEPGRERSSINLLINEAVKLTQTEVRSYGARIRMILNQNLPEVQVDQLQFIQALVNLILNALESMNKESNITPRLVIVSRKNGLDKIEIIIRDNGLTTSDKITAIMTDPLFLIECSSIRMSLPITRAVIENHSGSLLATANRHRGMTLSIIIPCAEEKN